MKKTFLIFGGFSGAIAVAMGAMGAHALKGLMEKGLLEEKMLHTFKTGAEYQMYHSIVLVLLAFLSAKSENKLITYSANCFMVGIFLFSGSLYLLSTGKLMGMENLKWLGPITPLGGLFFIAGWVMLGVSGIRYKPSGK